MFLFSQTLDHIIFHPRTCSHQWHHDASGILVNPLLLLCFCHFIVHAYLILHLAPACLIKAFLKLWCTVYYCNVQSMHAHTDMHMFMVAWWWVANPHYHCLRLDCVCMIPHNQICILHSRKHLLLLLLYWHDETSRAVSHCHLASLPPLSLAPPSPPPSHGSVVAAESDNSVQLKHLLSITSDTSEGVSTPQYDATSTWA